jgi:RNA polymerase sigma-70 factor (ECF subfamily)
VTENSEKTEQKADSAHLSGKWYEAQAKSSDLERIRVSLATRLRSGSREAAAELVDMYYQQIYLYMRRLGHSSQVSEDLTQESFLQAWQHIRNLRSDKALTAWLYRIAGNVSRLHLRRRRGKETASIDRFATGQASGDEQISDFDELERLKEAVGKLPEKLREVVVLHYMQHLTISEAAEAAGVREGTLKSRLNRALTFLRREFC